LIANSEIEMDIKLLSPNNFPDYELIDAGNFEKLERFGQFTLIRPEPQAIWNRKLPEAQWLKLAHAKFKREVQKRSYRSGDSENGGWTKLKPMPDNWNISYTLPTGNFKLKLALTTFGHLGVFPEQAQNWDYMYHQLTQPKFKNAKILNAFAYTGAASLAACIAGADVTHLDAVKQVVNWNKENSDLSELDNIRRIVDDAPKFLRREAKRGKVYQGIIIDPPAYGRGPEGEKWILEEGINELLDLCSQLIDKNNFFFILNLYSLGYSSLIASNLVDSYFEHSQKEAGEFYLKANSGVVLPLGTFVRISK